MGKHRVRGKLELRHPVLYADLERQIRARLEADGRSFVSVILTYKAAGLTRTRALWDLYAAAVARGTQAKVYREGLNDKHVETALESIAARGAIYEKA